MVVLHERANAVWSGTDPRSKLSSLGMVRPSMFADPGHGTTVVGVTVPACSAAEVVTVLKVEPGGYRPVRAIGPCASAAEFCATATTSPVEGRIATTAAAFA